MQTLSIHPSTGSGHNIHNAKHFAPFFLLVNPFVLFFFCIIFYDFFFFFFFILFMINVSFFTATFVMRAFFFYMHNKFVNGEKQNGPPNVTKRNRKMALKSFPNKVSHKHNHHK